MKRIWLRGGALAAGSALLAGCQFGGLNSVALPGTAGHGSGSYSITVDLADVATLPQNSPVMVDDVTVGSVSGIDALQRPDGSFFAAVKLALDRNVILPANSTAKVAQTSLLGSQHVELAAPNDQPSVGKLVNGSTIQESRTDRFPTTEEVLSALGVVVNKGNLAALQDITDEAYKAFAGRETQFVHLVPHLAELTAGLNNQVNDIIAAIDGLDRFSSILANNKDSLGRTLDSLPGALLVLNKNRDKILEAFGALKKVTTVAAHVPSQTKVDFAEDLKSLYSATKALADNRKNFVSSLQILLTFPFPNFGIKQAVRGDYLNVFTTFDLTVRRLGETFFTTSWPLDPNMLHMKEILNPPDFLLGEMANLSGQAADPFKIPTGNTRGRPLMLDRLTKVQLAIFGVVTVITVVVMAVFYLRLPAALGIGTYSVTADFVAGGGLYKNANVTYRGVAVGRVESVGLNPHGVDAVMRLNSGTTVPSNVSASVKSVSAIGEQYIDLVPPAHPAETKLHNGSRIARDNTMIGVEVATLLHQSETLVNSVADTRLRELLHETFTAFNGSGPELARLIQSARLLVDEANVDFPQTSQLIDQVGPFLKAQIRSGNDIRSLSDGLARFTSEVRNADPQLRTTLSVAPGAVDEANTAFSGIRPTFPMLAANLANLGRVGVIYHKSIEQLLVVLPALFAAIITSANGEPQDEGAKLDFKINVDPPPCNTGFVPPPMIRTPADETLRELPTDMYCKTAPNDPSTVRGARNYPCQEFPGKRAPTVALCRDPRGYVPIGTNPWRGPPIPYDTPVTNGLNILPPNRYPYIPPGADPDPGAPIAGPLPPGVVAGPGPAPNQPFPVQPPPNTGGTDGRQAWIPPSPYPPQDPQIPFPKAVPAPPPPEGLSPPAPYPPPEKPWGPPPGPAPRASGAAFTTYDQTTGAFLDPDGSTGIFAPGRVSSAESWVDLMRDPRQL